MPRLAPLGLLLLIGAVYSTESAAAKRPPPVVGRWNLTVTAAGRHHVPVLARADLRHQDRRAGRPNDRARWSGPTRWRKVEWKKNELIFVDAPGDRPGRWRPDSDWPGPDDGSHSGPTGKQTPALDPPRTYRAKIRFGNLEGTSEAPDQPTWTMFGARPPKFHERGRVPWGKPVTLVSRGLHRLALARQPPRHLLEGERRRAREPPRLRRHRQ